MGLYGDDAAPVRFLKECSDYPNGTHFISLSVLPSHMNHKRSVKTKALTALQCTFLPFRTSMFFVNEVRGEDDVNKKRVKNAKKKNGWWCVRKKLLLTPQQGVRLHGF